MGRQKYKLPNDPTVYNVNVDSETGKAWLSENSNAQLVEENTDQGKTNSDVVGANAELKTTASDQGTNLSNNNQQENTGSGSEDGSSESNFDENTQAAMDELGEVDIQNPHLKQFEELGLNPDDYSYSDEDGWVTVGTGETIPIDENNPEHGEAVKILEEKRLKDKAWGSENVPVVEASLIDKDDSESLNEFRSTYSEYGFEFEDDSDWSDSIKITAKNGKSKSFPVDHFINAGKNDARVANEMTQWLKENASRSSQSAAEANTSGRDAVGGMQNLTDLTVQQKSINKGKANTGYNEYLDLQDQVDAITPEMEAEEAEVRRGVIRELSTSSGKAGMNPYTIDSLVAQRMKAMGKPVPSVLKKKLEGLDEGDIGQSDQIARMRVAKERYADELGLEGEERRKFMNSNIKQKDLSIYSSGETNLEDVYNGIDRHDPGIAELSKQLVEQTLNGKTTLKNITSQIENLDGAWGNLIFKTDLQEDLEKQGQKSLDNLSDAKKKAIGNMNIVSTAYDNKITELKELAPKIDIEGTNAKIEEIQSKKYSTSDIDNIAKQIKKVQSGKYTTQAQVDAANEELESLSNKQQTLIDEYNSNIEADQSAINSLVDEQQTIIDEYNGLTSDLKALGDARASGLRKLGQIGVEENQMASYINALGKNHQLGTQMGVATMNGAIDLAQGIEEFTYMINPFGATSDYLIEEGYLDDTPWMKDVLNVAKLITGQGHSVDWDGDSETPTAREGAKEAIDNFQSYVSSTVQDPPVFDDIKSISDAGEWAAVMLAGQAPQLALMAATGGTAGLVLMGASAAGQKFDIMEKERKAFKESGGEYGMDHSFWTTMGVSLLSGTAESLSERITLGQMKYVKGVLRGTVKEARDAGLEGAARYFRQKVISPNALYRTGRDFVEEGGSEFAAQIANNVLDWSTGKDVGLFDGGLESFVSGTLMSGMIKTPILFNHAMAPFQSVSARQALDSNNARLQQVNRMLHEGKDTMSEAERTELQEEVGQLLSTNKQLIETDVNRIDMLDKEKSTLLKLDANNRKLRKEYSRIQNDRTLPDDIKQQQIAKLNESYTKNLERKNEIIDKYPPKDVTKHHKQQMALIEKYNNDIKAKGGSLDIQVKEISDSQMKEDIAQDTYGQSVKSVESWVGQVDTEIERANSVINNDSSTPKQVAQAKKDLQQAKIFQKQGITAMNMLRGSSSTYGSMMPRFSADGKKLEGFDISINKDTALKNGKFATAAHEFVHAAIYNTIKQDPEAREVLGTQVRELLNSKRLKFKSESDRYNYEKRIAGYAANERGEEMLTIASEMLSEGTLEFNDGLLQNFKDLVRNASQKLFKRDLNLDTKDDVRDFLKAFHKSVRNNKVDPRITEMMTKGSRNKTTDAKTPDQRKSERMHSKTVEMAMKSDPDLMERFDKFTKYTDKDADSGLIPPDKDIGDPKYESQEEWEASMDYYDAFLEIVESNGLDGSIRGPVVSTIKPEDMAEFVKNVKKRIGDRFLPKRIEDKDGNPMLDSNGQEQFKPGYKISNDSLFGWLTGVAGGAGKSIIFRARGDEMLAYNKRKKIEDQAKSLSTPKGDSGRTIGDDILADRDVELERLDGEDLTPRRKELVKEVINELKAREVLGLQESTTEVIDNAIMEAAIPLDGLIYKDIKEFVKGAEKITRRDKSGNTIMDKKTGQPKLFKPTKTADAKPNGPLFKVLEAVSKEFGVDPLRILADQDLNGDMRKAAQALIYDKSVNPDGTFDDNMFQLLAEGETRSGVATGAANTKLGELYTEGDRASFAEGATAAGKPTQTKMDKIEMDTWLGLFGIKPDGTFEGGTKNDGAIRALIVQMAQLEANQSMRRNAYENGTIAEAAIAKLGEGKGRRVWSKKGDGDLIDQFYQGVTELSAFTPEAVGVVAARVLGTSKGKLEGFGVTINKIVKDTVKELEGIVVQNEVLQGQREAISGKSVLDILRDTRTKNEYNQGVKQLLKPLLPLNEKGKPINPGNIVLTIDGVNKQRDHIVLTTKALYEQSGPELTYEDRSEVYNDDSWMGSDFTVAEDGELEGMTWWEVEYKKKKDSREKEAVIKAATMMIAFGKDGSASSSKMGDGRFIATKPGGKIIDTPGWQDIKDSKGNIVYGKKWKRYTAKDAKNGDIPKGSKIGDVKFKNGKLVPQDNRQQPTDGVDDYVALVNKGLPKGYEIVRPKDGEYILISPDGTKTKLDTTLPGESTKALFADIARAEKANPGKGLFDVFIKRKNQALQARKMAQVSLDLAWKRVQDSNDSFNAGDFGLLVMALGSNMNAPLRKAAYADRVPANYEALVAKYGKNAVGQLFQYEHGTPKIVVASKIIESYINDGVMNEDVWDNYTVQVIHNKLDNLIDASGHKTTVRIDGAPRAFNVDTLALVKSLTKEELSEIAPLISMDPSNPDVMGEAWVSAANDIHSNVVPSHIRLQNLSTGRRSGMWSRDTLIKGMSAFDFDETLIVHGENFVVATDPATGNQVKISSDQWPIKGPELAQQGYEFDFSDFANVRGGQDGPLLQKMRNQIDKYGPKNVFIVTARQQDSAGPIHEWLKSKGINIPFENITGLGKSEGSAKGEWMLQKFNEGYNDMYFVDDALPNVKAVKDVLDQLDIKSKVVQAKLKFSKEGSAEFNAMLERDSGVGRHKEFSGAQAKLRGANISRFKFFVPPSAEDFKGLLYTFLGKGKQGDADMKFFKEHLLDPFASGIRNINNTKQKMSDEYTALKKTFPKAVKSLNKKVGDTYFTTDNAVRVYLWNQAGYEVPGLSKQDLDNLLEHVVKDAELIAFAEILGKISRMPKGYIKPGGYWLTESIASDLHNVTTKINRSEFLAEWVENKNIIFSPENLNKIEAVYGTSFRDALEDILFRMEKGTNRASGNDKIVNNFQDWINGSVGAVMFFNTRSAVLQTLSTVNFLDWQDNNLFKAAGAFANQKQYWSDFLTLFNSDMLKQRRAGMQLDVNMSELMDSVSTAKIADKSKAAIRYLLQVGFTPTQIADSFAISAGGATFYRNKIKKYLKEGLSQKDAETRAFEEFQEIAEETQQSSRPDLISQQQAGTLGRLILAWANTPMQYTRLTKKAISDLVNGRGDWRSNVSRIIYYGAAQNFIFSSLQTGLAFLLFGGDEEEEAIKTKEIRVANGMLDTLLRGTGIYGAMASTLKNTILQYKAQREKGYGKQNWDKVVQEMISLSPPIGSKVRKIMNAIKTYEYNKGVPEKMGMRIDNPILSVVGNVVESITNFPLDRLIRKANNIDEAITGQHEMWQRVALMLGWNTWSIGIKDEDVEEAKAEVKVERKEKKAEEKKIKKAEEKKAKEEEKKAEEQKKKDEGFKQVRCSGIKSNGHRCSITIETKAKTAKCTYHKAYKPNEGSDRNNNGIKEYQCKSLTGSGKRCKNRTENKNKKCYAHQ